MDTNIEQRICLKFCIANGISCAESLKMLQRAYGESTLSKTRAYEWYSAFKSGRDVVEDLPRSGRPSTVSTELNIAKVKEMVSENRHLGLREIAAELSVSHESIRTILNDCLGMTRVAARIVPKDLNFLQKLNRVRIAEDMLEQASSDPTFMKRIVTGDETWVYEFDTQTSQQASEWRLPTEPKPKRARQTRSKLKVMLTVFFDYRGVVHSEFLPEGQMVNKDYYLSVMRRLREQIRRKRPDLWKDNSWILHHDNAPAHKAIIVNEFLAKNSTNLIEQPPYSPDLAPADFFLFPKLKLPLRGTRFQSIEDIKENSRRQLTSIPKSAYKKCFDDWIIRWHKCIISEGAYFEGDKIKLDE